MHKTFKRMIGAFLVSAMIFQPFQNILPLIPLRAAAQTSLDDFAAEVRALTRQDHTDEYYQTLRYDKATKTLYRDDVPVGDTCGEIVVENDTLMLDTSGLLPRSLRRSSKKPLSEAAAKSGYTYSESDTEILITNEFQTARLIVKAYQDIDTYGAESVVSGYRNLYILQYRTTAEAYAAYGKYQSDPSIEFVQPSRIIQLEQPDEAASDSFRTADVTARTYNTWGAAHMGVDPFIEQYLSSERLPEIIVAVVDTGINRAQSSFAGRILDDEVNYSNSGNDTAADDYGHGTHCTGTICELTPDNVKILPVKVFDKKGSGTDEQIYLGLMYAIEQNADIVSMSFGGLGVSPLEIEAMSIADEHGLTCVAAAGNNGDDAAYYYPGGIDTCITVAAVDRDFKLAEFSNYGTMIDVAAPGVDILSTVLGENDELEAWDGTSMATPHVTACCALLKSYDQSLTPAKIQALIQANAADIGKKGFDKEFGWGFISMNPFNWCDGICHAPTFSFKSGNYGNAIHVELECPTEEAAIYYTTDGSVPSPENGMPYTEAITVSESTWIRAIAVHEGYESSRVSEAAYTICGQDVSDPFLIENGVITTYRGIAAAPVIPSKAPDGTPITAIGDGAFAENAYLVTLNLPSSITEIHDNAFRECANLRTVSGESVVNIGSYAFTDCDSLEEIQLSETISSIGTGAFSGCTVLEEIRLYAVLAVPDACFSGCESLESAEIPMAVTIGADAFAGCILLSDLNCPWNEITAIGNRAFSDCCALSGELSLRKLQSVGEAAFSGMTALQSILLSEQITALPANVLADCSALRYLSAPAVTVLGPRALALKKAAAFNLVTDLPFHQITEIGADAFAGCPLGDGMSMISFDALKAVPTRGFAEAYGGAVALPNVTEIHPHTFQSASFHLLSLPAVQSLSDSAVSGCQIVVLPNQPIPVSEHAIADTVQILAAPTQQLPEIYANRLITSPIWARKTASARTALQFSYPEFCVLAAGIGITYQWYLVENGALTRLEGENQQIFVPSTRMVGNTQYVCQATDQFGQVVSADFFLTVTEHSAESLSDDTPLYLETTALQSFSFSAPQSVGYTLRAIGNSRLIGLITDSDNHMICELDTRTQQLSADLSEHEVYQIHVRQLLDGISQLTISDRDVTAVSLSDCQIEFRDTYHHRPDTPFTPELRITSPAGTVLAEQSDYQICTNLLEKLGVITVFGVGSYQGCISLPVKVYTVVLTDTPALVSLNSAKDEKTFAYTPEESGRYYYYATYTNLYQTEYEAYLRTGSAGVHKSYDTKAACKVYDGSENLIASNSFNPYTGSRFSAAVELLAGQTYYFVCSSRSAAEYNLMIAPEFRTIKNIKVLGNFSAFYDDTEPYTPKIKVMLNSEPLIEQQDYVLVHGMNDVPGMASISIIGIGKYAGIHTQEYKISYDGLNLSDNTITLDTPQTLDLMNNRIETFWFTADSGVEGKTKTSYTIESSHPNFLRCSIYKQHAAMDAYSLITTADGKTAFELENGTYCMIFYSAYPDTRLQPSVTIHRPYNLNQAVITAKDVVYTGDPVTPEITVTVDGTVLTQDVDYQIRFLDEHALFGTREFLIIPQNTYTAYDSCLGSFEIVVELPENPPLLTVGEHETDVTLTDRLAVYRICPDRDMRCLIVSTDVMDTVTRIFDADTNLINEVHGTGTQHLTFDAKANETYYLMIKFNGFDREGKLHFEFRDTFRLLEECETEIQPVVWTGEKTVPEIKFFDNGKQLTEGVDYQLRYCNDEVNIGTASANFIGLGDYYGSCMIHYDIIAPDLFGLEDFAAFPMLHQKKYSGEEETECDYLIYKYTSGLDTKLSLRIYDLFCRMTLQLYDASGNFLKSAEFKTNGEIPFELKANETMYILMSATDINSSNQTFVMNITDISNRTFRNVTDPDSGVVYRTCPELSYAEVFSLDPEAKEAVLLPSISDCPVTFVPEAVFCHLPVPYTIYGYDGCDAEAYSEKYGFAYLNPDRKPSSDHIPGDFNCDGTRSIADAVLLNYLIGEAPMFPSDTVNWDGADGNGDGLLNLYDLHAFLESLSIRNPA